jgi:hypothetical protein
MDEKSWLAWPFWSFMGSWATVISLVAIAFALVELLRQRRQVRPTVWGIDLWGSVSIDDDVYHVADLYNAGSGTAAISTAYFVNARPHLYGDYQHKSVFGSNEKVRVLISAEKIATAWLFISWREHADSRRIWAEWLPVVQAGGLQEAAQASLERTFFRRFSRWTMRHTVRPVGPNHYLRTSWKVTKDANDSLEKTRTAYSLITATDPSRLFAWSYPRGTMPPDIPYVGPPMAS